MNSATTAIRTVAVLGTGAMGAPIARRLAEAGFTVRAWNRTTAKAEPLRDHGVQVAESPAEAVAGADAVLTMLFDAAAVEQSVTDAGEALPSGAVWLQVSTVGPEATRRLAELADRHNLTYVDVPVLGSSGPAAQGALIALASGPASVRDRIEPVLDAFSKKILWVGEVGASSQLKLALNAWVLALTHATAESVALCEGFGLDPRLFVEALDGGPTDSPYAHLKAPLMLAHDYPTSFSVEGASKDSELICAAARAAGLSLSVAEGVRQGFRDTLAAGYRDEDMAAVYETKRRPH